MRAKKNDAPLNSSDRIHHSGLEKRQSVLSVVFMVVLPYFKSKLHSVYNKEREARLQARLWGSGDKRFNDANYFDGAGGSLVSTGTSDMETSIRIRLKKKIQKIIFVCYPWLHASCEVCKNCDAVASKRGLHALGLHVCRATGQELMDNSSRISKIRSRERDGLCGPPWLKALQGAILRCAYVMLDYAQTGLIASVFIFKMMEWWYQSAEERMSAPTVYPPPPPPPPPKYKRCPVTLMPATVEQIRRPFHDV